MKRFYFLFALCLSVTGTALAQNYATNWDGQNSTQANRFLKKITVTPAGGTATEIPVHSAVRSALVVDKTATRIEVSPGQKLDVSIIVKDNVGNVDRPEIPERWTIDNTANANGCWENAYVYVDEDKNGFNISVNATDHTIGGDMRAWSYYSFSTTSDNPGFNQKGENCNTNILRANRELEPFSAPQAAGEYRMRVKMEWNNAHPAGGKSGQTVADGGGVNSNMQTNGGCIVDLTLVVVNSVATAKAALLEKINAAKTYQGHVGTALGQYTSSEITTETLLTEAINAAQSVYDNADATIENVQNATTTLQNKIAFSINQPETGKFYRFKTKNGEKYLATNVGDNRLQATTDGNGVESIFFLDASKRPISFKNGLGIKHGIEYACPVTKADAQGVGGDERCKARFSSSNEIGWYLIDVDSTTVTKNLAITSTGFIEARRDTEGTDGGACWTIEEVATLPVTISNAGLATLYTPVALTIPAGIKAYYCTYDGGFTLKTVQVENTIPAGAGVLLEGTAGTTYNFEVTASDATPNASNILFGKFDSQRTLTADYTGKVIYTLQNLNSQPGFYKFNGTFLRGFGACIRMDAEIGGENALILDFNPTGINNIRVDEETTKEIYDLSGRRVYNPGKGLYIIHGQKTVIR